MRLRQAHALITTAAALEAAGIGINMHPFDVDENTAPHVTSDHMTGYAEFNDPDNPDYDTRTYNIDITPGPDDDEITIRVKFGYDPDGPFLMTYTCDVPPRAENSDSYDHGTYVAAHMVTSVIRHNEKPFEAAYAARTGQTPKEQQ